MLGKVVAGSIVAAITLLVILFDTTTPATIGPIGILIVFIMMYVSVLGVLTFLLYLGSRALASIGSFFAVRRPIQSMTLGRSYYYSSIVALAPVLFVGMQSVGEVSFYDVMLVIVFVVIGCIFIAKRT